MIGRLTLLAFAASASLAAQQPQPSAPAAQKSAPPAARPQDTKAQDTKTQGAARPADTKAADTKAGTKAPAGQGAGLAPAPEAAARVRVPVIMREVFAYGNEGRRDPFVTLLTSEELRPTVADLRLVGVLLDSRRPIAVMRDVATNAQYRVTTGMKIGRMTVALIKRRAVVFSIEEFGLNRTDSLVLGDTTKARPK